MEPLERRANAVNSSLALASSVMGESLAYSSSQAVWPNTVASIHRQLFTFKLNKSTIQFPG